jgi:hypothetical protein
MAKHTNTTIGSGFNSNSTLNDNFDSIDTELNDKVLYRDNPDGETNSMQNDFDMNGFSILNQGNPITIEGWEWEGPWLTATAYTVGDVVENGGSAYICIVAHTSGTFATDLAALDWELVASATLPTQSGESGNFLSTDGTTAAWSDIRSANNTWDGNNTYSGTNVFSGALFTQQALIVQDEFLNLNTLTGGTSTAYTLAQTGQAYTTYREYSVFFNAVCGNDPTLNIDSGGAKNLVDRRGFNLKAGMIGIGPHKVTYYSTDDTFIVSDPIPQALICRVTDSGSQSIANTTETTVTWDTETEDDFAAHDNVTSNHAITFPSWATRFKATFSSRWASNSTGYRTAAILDSAAAIIAKDDRDANTTSDAVIDTGWLEVGALTYIYASVYQSSGGALNFDASANSCWLQVEFQ